MMAGKYGCKVSSKEHSLFDTAGVCNQEEGVHLLTDNNFMF